MPQTPTPYRAKSASSARLSIATAKLSLEPPYGEMLATPLEDLFEVQLQGAYS